MEIGIIGAGFIGGTLARKLADLGHRVRIANSKDPSTLTEFDEIAGITPTWAAEAVDGVDIAIVSLPQKAIGSLSQEVITALSSARIVIDTGNYYPVRDGHIDQLDRGTSDSEWVAHHLGRPVYKAFNNIVAPSLKHKGTDNPDARVAVTVAGPAGESKEQVFTLVHQLGFDPVDGGDLEQSWRLQPGTPTYCKDMTADQLRVGLAETTQSDVEKYHAARDEMTNFDEAMAALRQYM